MNSAAVCASCRKSPEGRVRAGFQDLQRESRLFVERTKRVLEKCSKSFAVLQVIRIITGVAVVFWKIEQDRIRRRRQKSRTNGDTMP